MSELSVNYYHSPYYVDEQGAFLDYLRFRPEISKRHRRIIGHAAFLYYGADNYGRFVDPRSRGIYDRLYEHVVGSLRDLALPSYTKPDEVRRIIVQNTAVPFAVRDIDRNRFAVVTFNKPAPVNLILR